MRRRCGPQNDSGHQWPELSQHRHPDAVHHKDDRPKLPSHQADFEGNDHSHEETHQKNDWDCVSSDLRGDIEDVCPGHRARVADGLHERTTAESQEAQQLPEQPELRNRRSTDLLKHPHMATGRNRAGELSHVISMKQGGKIGWERLKDHTGARGALLTTEIKK